MAFKSLGDFIKAANKSGEVLHVEGANLEMDVGGLTELMILNAPLTRSHY